MKLSVIMCVYMLVAQVARNIVIHTVQCQAMSVGNVESDALFSSQGSAADGKHGGFDAVLVQNSDIFIQTVQHILLNFYA